MQAKMSNNGEARLASPIGTYDTTLYLQSGQGALFRPLAAGEWAPLTIIDSAGNFEIVKATALAGDAFTIERHQEGTTERAFSAGDRVQNRLTAAVIDEIGSDLAGLSAEAAAVAANIQKQLYTAFTSAGPAPAFTLTPVPAPDAYVPNLCYRVKFHAAGSGADTLNVSGLGAKSIKQYNSVGAKVAAVIASGQLADVEYDGADFVILDPLPNVALPGFRNRLINGAMQVDQRNVGTSQTFTAGAALSYCVDRFYGYCTGANITGQRTALPNGQNRYRFTGATSNTGLGFGQRIEAANSMDLAGQTATLQAKLSSTSLTSITWTAYYANTADSFGTLASPTRTQIATGTFTINGMEATYNAQISIPVAATTGIEVVFTAGALLAGQTLNIGNVQLEPGSQATPFEARPYGMELALSQRYYAKSYADGVVPGTAFAAQAGGVTFVSVPVGAAFGGCFMFPVTLRSISPTITLYDTTGAAGKTSYYSSGVITGGAATGVYASDRIGFMQCAPASSAVYFQYTVSAEL